MTKRKICVVVTARPSYSRVKTALTAIERHPDLELQLVVSGSALLNRYGDAVKVIEHDGFRIARKVYMVIEGENLTSMAKTTGLGLSELATAFDNLRPDMVVSIADRYETIATAIAAAYMNIPLVHLQGGEVTGSIDEKVRHTITKLADVHLVSSERAKARVIQMGEAPGSVFVTGCPSIDLAAQVAQATALAFDPFEYGGVGSTFDISDGYIVVLQHPVTTEYQASREHIEITLKAVTDVGKPSFWFWPNVDAGSDGTSKGIRAFRENHPDAKIRFFKNFEPQDFLRLLSYSRGIVGNSSVAIREASFLGVPAVNIGTRQNGRERGCNVLDVDYDIDQIRSAIIMNWNRRRCEPERIYGDGSAGSAIARVLGSVRPTIEKVFQDRTLARAA